MKKLLIILSLIFICCSSDNKHELSKQFKFLTPEFDSEVTIDFSKNRLELIEDFEDQIQKNICDSSPFLKGSITKNNDKISFPIIVYKYCGQLVHFRNKIPVLINYKNEILIDQEFFIKPSESLEKKIITATNNLIEHENKQQIVYVIVWDTKIENTKITDRFIELFSAMKTILNDLSMEKYQKSIDQLTATELIALKKIYHPMIGIEQEYIIENN